MSFTYIFFTNQLLASNYVYGNRDAEKIKLVSSMSRVFYYKLSLKFLVEVEHMRRENVTFFYNRCKG